MCQTLLCSHLHVNIICTRVCCDEYLTACDISVFIKALGNISLLAHDNSELQGNPFARSFYFAVLFASSRLFPCFYSLIIIFQITYKECLFYKNYFVYSLINFKYWIQYFLKPYSCNYRRKKTGASESPTGICIVHGVFWIQYHISLVMKNCQRLLCLR